MIAEANAAAAARQPELFDRATATVTAADIDWLIARLKGAPEPRSAARLWAETHGIAPSNVTEGQKRRVREIADAADPVVTGTSKGYQLTAEMAPEPFRAAQNRRWKMARETQRGCISRERYYHANATTSTANR